MALSYKNIVLSFKTKLKDDRNFTLLIIVGMFAGLANGLYNTVFSNFLHDTYNLSESGRGLLELPREFPGLITVLVLGSLAFLGDIYMCLIAMFLAGIGAIGMGYWSPTYIIMVCWLMVQTMGTHLFMPLAPSIGMKFSKPHEFGKRLASYSACGLIGTIVGYVTVWVGFKFQILNYSRVFLLVGIFFFIAMMFVLKIGNKDHDKSKVRRFVFKKKYSLYYILCLLYGARKQIFLTFAPWVLIKIFHLEVTTFAILGLIIAFVSIVTRTIVGNAIDKLGERFVLSAEAILLIIICCGYIFAADWFSPAVAVVIMAACYVIDSSMSVVEMARSTYVKKMVDSHDELTPTLATGQSIDHVFSMTTPFMGGLLWSFSGSYKAVFAVAALVAIINFFLSLKINVKK